MPKQRCCIHMVALQSAQGSIGFLRASNVANPTAWPDREANPSLIPAVFSQTFAHRSFCRSGPFCTVPVGKTGGGRASLREADGSSGLGHARVPAKERRCDAAGHCNRKKAVTNMGRRLFGNGFDLEVNLEALGDACGRHMLVRKQSKFRSVLLIGANPFILLFEKERASGNCCNVLHIATNDAL